MGAALFERRSQGRWNLCSEGARNRTGSLGMPDLPGHSSKRAAPVSDGDRALRNGYLFSPGLQAIKSIPPA